MKKVRLALLAMIVVLSFNFVLLTRPVVAQTGANAAYCQKSVGGFLGFPTWYKYLNPRIEDPDDSGPIPASCQIDFEFTAAKIGGVLMAVLEMLLRVAALAAVALVIWGGIQIQLSQGEPDRFSNARTTIINALIGLAIAISATVIVNFLGNSLA